MALKPILVKSKENVSSTNRLECSVCKKRFWMTSKYLDHMATHKHFSLSCNICNEGFLNQKDLDEHYLTHSEVINTYDCDKCSKKFLQKYELVQHIQSLCTALNEPPQKKRKTVHFNTELESINIEDFSDNEEEYSESDEDFTEDYVPYKIFTQTRSGRVVKAKKIFSNEVEAKPKYSRKSQESNSENSVVTNDSHYLATSTVEKAKKIFSSEVEVKPKYPRKSQESNSEKSVVTNDSHFLATSTVEKANKIFSNDGEVKLKYSRKSQESNVEKSVVTNNNKYLAMSTVENLKLKSDTENDDQNSTIVNSKRKPVPAKQLCVLVEKLPDHIYKEYVEKGNICAYKNVTEAEKTENEMKNQTVNVDQICSQNPNNGSDPGPISFSLWAKTQEKKEISSKIKENITSNTTEPSKSGSLTTRSSIKLATPSKSHSLSEPCSNLKPNKLPNVTADIAKIKNSVSSVPSNIPVVKKEFVFVGANPNVSQIAEVIREMTTMSKDKIGNRSSNLHPTVCNKNVSNVSHSNIASSGKIPVICQSTVSNGMNQKNTACMSKNTLNANLPVESEEGILDKKVVRGITFIKVTEEYMKKIQKQNFQASAATVLKSKNEAQSISDEVSMITSSKNSVSVSKIKTKAIQTQEITPVTNRNMPSTSGTTVSHKIPVNADNKLAKESCVPEKIPCNQQNTEDIKIDKLSELEALSAMSNNEKLFERYKAKLEEKERKKKEKYEFKKKLRYMAKLLGENIHTKKDAKDKIQSPKLAEDCGKLPKDIAKVYRDEKKKSENINTKKGDKDKKQSPKLAEDCERQTKDIAKVYRDEKKDSENINTKKGDKDKKQSPKLAEDCERQPKDIAKVYRDEKKKSENINTKKGDKDKKQSPKLAEDYERQPKDITKVCGDEKKKSAECYKKNREKDKLIALEKCNVSAEPLPEEIKQVQTCEEAMEAAKDISLKFNLNLSEDEYFKLFSSLDILITRFNIAEQCQFLIPVVRFCRLYVENYKVKERAIAFGTKLSKFKS